MPPSATMQVTGGTTFDESINMFVACYQVSGGKTHREKP